MPEIGSSMGKTIVQDNGQVLINSKIMGIDIGEIVDSQIKVGKMPLDKKKEDIEHQTKVMAAFSEMEEKISSIRTVAAKLSNLNTSGSTSSFKQKRANAPYTASGAPAISVVAFTVTDNTPNQNFDLQVQTKAKADRFAASSSSGGALDTALNYDGTLTLASTGNDPQTVTITTSMTLEQIRNEINSVSSLTNVRASIVQAGASDFRLNLSHTQTGKKIELSDTGGLMSSLNIAESSATDQSLCAHIIFNGVDTYHPTNIITTLVEGVTIEPISAAPGDVVNVSIEPNLDSTKTDIVNFVKAYNDFVDFFVDQHARDENNDNNYSKEAYLARNTFLDTLNTTIGSSLFGGGTGIASGQIQILADIGITIEGSDSETLSSSLSDGQNILNKLIIDDGILDSKLLGSLDQVRRLFAFEPQLSNVNFIVSDHPNAISSDIAGQSISVTVSRTGADYSVTFTKGAISHTGTVEDTGSGLRLIAPDDTIFEGIKMAYVNATIADGDSATTTVVLSQGIADKLNNYLSSVLDIEGSLSVEKENLKDKSNALKNELTRLSDKFERDKQYIITKFSRLQETLRQMEALMNNMTSYMGALASKQR